MKTKERILLSSLALFNELGEPHVTTLDISTEMEISPGNLYYHYKGKDEIIASIYQRFEDEMSELLMLDGEADSALFDIWVYLQLSFEVMTRYQFLYRDITDLLSRYQNLQRRFNKLMRAQQQALRLLVARLQAEQIFEASADDAAVLIDHMTMTMIFWINYQQVTWPHDRPFEPNAGRGAYQVICLLAPYLEEDSRAELRSIAADYANE